MILFFGKTHEQAFNCKIIFSDTSNGAHIKFDNTKLFRNICACGLVDSISIHKICSVQAHYLDRRGEVKEKTDS